MTLSEGDEASFIVAIVKEHRIKFRNTLSCAFLYVTLTPAVPLRQAIGHKAEDLAGGFFDWLLAADNQVGKLASRQNEFFTSWTHIGVVLHEHKVQVVAVLGHVPRLT